MELDHLQHILYRPTDATFARPEAIVAPPAGRGCRHASSGMASARAQIGAFSLHHAFPRGPPPADAWHATSTPRHRRHRRCWSRGPAARPSIGS
jgi:hypothetical protein